MRLHNDFFVRVEIDLPLIHLAIDMINLPGMMTHPREGWPHDTPDIAMNLTRGWILNNLKRAVILVVVDAKQTALQTHSFKVITGDILQKRAIGILTRCDKVCEEDIQEDIMGVIEARPGAPFIRLHHGYYATCARLNNSEEMQWFADNGCVGERLGVDICRNSILIEFSHFIENTWKQHLIRVINEKKQQLKDNFSRLGKPFVFTRDLVNKPESLTQSDQNLVFPKETELMIQQVQAQVRNKTEVIFKHFSMQVRGRAKKQISMGIFFSLKHETKKNS